MCASLKMLRFLGAMKVRSAVADTHQFWWSESACAGTRKMVNYA